MVFKPKGSEKMSHKASYRLFSELTGTALKSTNRDEYSKKQGHSPHTQNIQNEDKSSPSHSLSIT